MKAQYRALGKKLIAKVLPDSTKLRHLFYLPRLESFRKKHQPHPVFENRRELYRYLNQDIIKNTPIFMCEFGVYKGVSLKYWAKINQSPLSQFYGFDTFSGLPEKWVNFTGVKNKNTFNTKGVTPAIEDSRVGFVKGLFQETLPQFLSSNKITKPLVIHADADLYSSTLYFLTKMDEVIVAGTIIIFDEFSSMLHEFRALEDYTEAYNRRYEVLGATVSKDKYYTQLAIRFK